MRHQELFPPLELTQNDAESLAEATVGRMLEEHGQFIQLHGTGPAPDTDEEEESQSQCGVDGRLSLG